MVTIDSLSGGKSSSFLTLESDADVRLFSLVCINDPESTPPDPSIVRYVNEKLEKYIPEFGEFIATAEDDLTLYAMRDLEQYIGKEILWVRGMSYDDVIDKGTQTRLPSWARRYCTEKMKLLPIFLWWFHNIGVKCKMNIGFRFDEFKRMENFFNNSDPTNFKIPISCNNYGAKRQNHINFNWRNCSFPMIRNIVTKEIVEDYWKGKPIKFPAISNCVGCFHKKESTLAAMAEMNPFKMGWFARQELKGMGTWLDNKVTYQHLIDNSTDLAKEVLYELKVLGQSCDSGGCTD